MKKLSREELLGHIRRSAEQVKTWPLWKRSVLDVESRRMLEVYKNDH